MPLSADVLEKLIEASPDLVIATDAGGKVVYYNDGARDNLGYARDEIIGEHVDRLYPSRDEACRVMAAMRDPAAHSKGRVESFPTLLVGKDGSEIPVAISGVILYRADETEQGTIGFGKNLTEILRKDQLAVLGEIAVGLSHEINNPLEVITNQLSMVEDLVERRASAGERDSALERIQSLRKEVGRITSLLGRLSDMAASDHYESTHYVQDARMVDLREGEHVSLRGARLLVVDDDEGVRRTLADLLSLSGCRVAQASNGLEALEVLKSAAFDLVLSDVVMPDMDGYDLYQESRRLYPELPVVLMTAFYHDQDHVIKRSRAEGLEGVLFKKPIDPGRLRDTLERLLRPPRPSRS